MRPMFISYSHVFGRVVGAAREHGKTMRWQRCAERVSPGRAANRWHHRRARSRSGSMGSRGAPFAALWPRLRRRQPQSASLRGLRLGRWSPTTWDQICRGSSTWRSAPAQRRYSVGKRGTTIGAVNLKIQAQSVRSPNTYIRASRKPIARIAGMSAVGSSGCPPESGCGLRVGRV